jgi:hypothetical protein
VLVIWGERGIVEVHIRSRRLAFHLASLSSFTLLTSIAPATPIPSSTLTFESPRPRTHSPFGITSLTLGLASLHHRGRHHQKLCRPVHLPVGTTTAAQFPRGPQALPSVLVLRPRGHHHHAEEVFSDPANPPFTCFQIKSPKLAFSRPAAPAESIPRRARQSRPPPWPPPFCCPTFRTTPWRTT